ncbi:MAG TPA: hypothetical protein VFZ78_08490, partial [Flavisolibacter sp.]
FTITEQTREEYDYMELVENVLEVLGANNVTPFISEYREIRTDLTLNQELVAADQEMASLRYRGTAGKLERDKVPGYCRKAEHLLLDVFRKFYFILRYKLVVIRRIEILKYRSDQPRYVHNRIILHESIDNLLPEDDVVLPIALDPMKGTTDPNPPFTDSYSVMLFRGLSDFTSYLNLSPFAIDMNVLKGEENSLLYLYSYVTETGGPVFEEVQNPRINVVVAADAQGRIEYVENLSKPPKVKRQIRNRLVTLQNQFNKLRDEIAALKSFAVLQTSDQ